LSVITLVTNKRVSSEVMHCFHVRSFWAFHYQLACYIAFNCYWHSRQL